MLTYALDKTAGVSLYEQLYRRVKEDILSGRLAGLDADTIRERLRDSYV